MPVCDKLTRLSKLCGSANRTKSVFYCQRPPAPPTALRQVTQVPGASLLRVQERLLTTSRPDRCAAACQENITHSGASEGLVWLVRSRALCEHLHLSLIWIALTCLVRESVAVKWQRCC